jgi:hypothetical protein
MSAAKDRNSEIASVMLTIALAVALSQTFKLSAPTSPAALSE